MIKYLPLFLLFFACGPEALQKKLSISVQNKAGLLVIDAIVAARTNSAGVRLKDSIWIKITKSTVLNDLNFPIIEDATISLIPDGVAPIDIPFDAAKSGYFLLQDPILTVGNSYSLEIIRNGVIYRATAILQPLNTSINNLNLKNICNGFSGCANFLGFSFLRPKTGYYRIKVQYTLTNAVRQGLLKPETTKQFKTIPSFDDEQLIDQGDVTVTFNRRPSDKNIDENNTESFTGWVDARLETGDEALIQLIATDKSSNVFYHQIGGGGAGPGGNIPFNPQNNWISSQKGDEVLGYFSLWNSYEQVYITP